MTAKELREKRAKLATRIQELRDAIHPPGKDAREFTAEERTNWESVNKDYDALSGQITIAERAEIVAGEQTAPAAPAPGRENTHTDRAVRADKPSEEERALALQAWCMSRTKLAADMTGPQREAAEKCGVNFASDEMRFDLNLREGRAYLSSADGTAGGFTIPTTFPARFEVALMAHGGVLQVAEVLNTATGEAMEWPTSDDTSNSGAQIGENVANDEQAVAFGKFKLASYDYTSKLVRVPYTLIRDSAINLVGFLGDTLGMRLGRILNSYLTTGNGAAHPQGIVTGSSAGNTTASATAITADELINLVHQVDPAYRIGAGFMMHDGIVLAIRKLKTGDGQYLWQPGLTAGVPDRLLTYPLTVNQNMQATVASATKTVLFGQLSAYKVRIVGQVRLKRLVERYAEYDQEGFVALMSADGGLLDAGTHPVKHLLQAT